MVVWASHPWLTFELDLKKLSPTAWMLLGEARSKCDHLKGVPLRPETSKLLHEVFLAKGVHATTAIEGNTLSEQEVLKILRKQDQTPKTQQYLKNEITNILDASNSILDYVENFGIKPITPDDIKDYNRKSLLNLKLEEHVVPGQISKVQVGVPGYAGLQIENCEDALRRLCTWVNSDFKAPNEQLSVIYGLLKAIMSHLYLVWIHPFGDGNGRTARLLEVRFLLEAGVPSAAGHLLSNHYNKTRQEYYRQLSDASRSGGNVIPFIEYAIEGFVDQIREQLKSVKQQQWDVTWTNYIHEKFNDSSSSTMKRQRKLALALSEANKIVHRKDITDINSDVAREYASCGEKTLTRDLNSLVQMDLIERTKDGYRAKKETVLQFLPRARQGDREAQLREAKILEEVDDIQLDLDL
jgi:Fic family protein